MLSIVATSTVLWLVSLPSTSPAAGAGQAEGTATAALPRVDALPAGMEAFTETIPGTTASFTLVPIPGGAIDVAVPPAKEAPADAPETLTTVELAPFYMASVEVTWDLYDILVFRFDLPEEARTQDGTPDGVTRPTHPYIATDRGFGHNGWPAISISVRGAQSYCEWLSAKTGKRYRLPTEAEWEHAARAGTPRSKGPWWFGDDAEALKANAWFRLSSSLKTHPVGELPPNPFGLFDVYGNTAEWCTTADGAHVLRGGSYLDRADKADSFFRALPTPKWNASDPQLPKSVWWLADGPFAGFRVVCEAEDGRPAKAR